MSGNLYGVLDIGGTKIVTGIARDGEILGTRRVPTDPARGPDDAMLRLAAGIRAVRDELGLAGVPIAGVGASIPGPNDTKSGIVLASHNIGWFNYPFIERFRAEMGDIPVFMDDDANCAGMGEAYFGAGRGFRDQVYLTISTGIGGAVILGGRLHRGFQEVAGEVGHVVVVPGGPLCPCGGSGCIEAVASGPAIARLGRQLMVQEGSPLLLELAGGRGEDIDTPHVFEAARRGDHACLDILDDVATYLGIFLADLVHVLNPEAFVLGGGVMRQAELIMPRMDREMRAHLYKVQRTGVVLVQAQHGDRSGLYGALHLVMEGTGEHVDMAISLPSA
jgi:glucokinase